MQALLQRGRLPEAQLFVNAGDKIPPRLFNSSQNNLRPNAAHTDAVSRSEAGAAGCCRRTQNKRPNLNGTESDLDIHLQHQRDDVIPGSPQRWQKAHP